MKRTKEQRKAIYFQKKVERLHNLLMETPIMEEEEYGDPLEYKL